MATSRSSSSAPRRHRWTATQVYAGGPIRALADEMLTAPETEPGRGMPLGMEQSQQRWQGSGPSVQWITGCGARCTWRRSTMDDQDSVPAGRGRGGGAGGVHRTVL